MLYIVSAIERAGQKRIDLLTVEAPEPHTACVRGVKLLDAPWRKKIELASLEARVSTDNP